MSNEYNEWDDDDFDLDQDAGSGKDSNVLKELRKANRAKEKQIKELMETLTQLQTAQRERSVKDVLAAKGLNEKIAAFIPEGITSEQEVEEWVSQYADIFGVQAQTSDEGQPSLGAQEAAALNRISQTQSTGQTLSGDSDQLEALIRAASNPEELNNLLFGTPTGPTAY